MQQKGRENIPEKENTEYNYQTRMQRELVLQKLKERGCRITKQRLMLLDIILADGCTSCKEIYYKAIEQDAGIGTATVYRMVNTLEEIGAISRRSMYHILYDREKDDNADSYMIEFLDGQRIYLSKQNWNQVLQAGLAACGYECKGQIQSIIIA